MISTFYLTILAGLCLTLVIPASLLIYFFGCACLVVYTLVTL